MKSERVAWIDICRGIGIILVIYAHALSGDSYRHLIYAFHMPLFFFLSGTVFHLNKTDNFFHFLKKSAKSILLPYFLLAIATYLAWIPLARPRGVSAQEILNRIYDMIYANSNTHALEFNIVLWFLPTLFITRILFWFISKRSKNNKILAATLFIFSIIGYLSYIYTPQVKLPFGTETALTGLVFFGIGYLWSVNAERITNYIKPHLLPLIAICILLSISFATINYNSAGYQADLRMNRVGNYLYFYLAALSGIGACITTSMLIKKQSLLEYIGRHSLILFIWHLIAFAYFGEVLKQFISPQTISSLRNYILSPLYTIISITIILFGNVLFRKIKNKFDSFTTGNS